MSVLPFFSAGRGSDNYREDGVNEERKGDNGRRHGNASGGKFTDI